MAFYFKGRAHIVSRIFATELGSEAHARSNWGPIKLLNQQVTG
jgi:hypothetical protein